MALSLQSLDPRNFTQVQAPDPVKRFKTLADARGMMQDEQLRAVQIQKAEAELSSYRKQLQDADTVKAILAETGGDYEAALPRLFQVAPEVAMKIKDSLAAEAQKKALGLRGEALENAKALEGQPGPEFGTTGMAPMYQAPLPGDENQNPTMIQPEGQRIIGPAEHPEITVPSAWGGVFAKLKPQTRAGVQNQAEADIRFKTDEALRQNAPIREQNRINQERLNQDRIADNARQEARDRQMAEDARANRENARAIAAMPARSSVGTGSSAEGLPQSIAAAANRATMMLTRDKRNAVLATVKDLVEAGDEAQARQAIRQAALESEPVDTRRQIQGRREIVSALSDIEKALSNVPQNLLVGTAEDVARKLGTSTNKDLVAVGNRIALALQSYRRSMSGAAFSVPESAEYAKIFPGYSTTAPVNKALISSLKDAFATNDATFWKNKLGPGWSDSDNATHVDIDSVLDRVFGKPK